MSQLFRCDYCSTDLPEASGRIALEVVEPVEQSRQIDDDEFDSFAAVGVLRSVGFVGDNHFCNMSCLSAWAMTKALETPV